MLFDFICKLQFASLLNYRILCHTSFTISNVVGPQEEIMIGGNPITFLRANNSALPHVRPLNSILLTVTTLNT